MDTGNCFFMLVFVELYTATLAQLVIPLLLYGSLLGGHARNASWYIEARLALLREQENSASTVNMANTVEFIASIHYIYHQHCLDINGAKSSL